MLKNFSVALSFLTVFRLPFTDSILEPQELAASFACFPLAGFVLGLIYCATALVLKDHVPALLLSVLIASLTALLTRGLHFDGLADLADGLWGGSTPQRRLEIMKDSRIGTFGVLALIIAVCLKIASIHALISGNYISPLLIAPVFSRFAMAATAYGSRYARKDGLGKPFLENIKIEHLAIAAFLAIAVAIPAGFKLMLCFVPVLVCVIFFRTISAKYLGGITGDVLGAVNEVAEVVVLAFGACFTGQ